MNPFEKGPSRNIERTITCPKCNGNRTINGKTCERCDGSGKIIDKN